MNHYCCIDWRLKGLRFQHDRIARGALQQVFQSCGKGIVLWHPQKHPLIGIPIAKYTAKVYLPFTLKPASQFILRLESIENGKIH